MNGDHARLIELKAENEKLRKELAGLTRKIRDVSERAKAVANELRELIDNK